MTSTLEPYEALEVEWAKFNGSDPDLTVGCSSGTAALHLAFEALQLPSRSVAVMSDYNMIACPRAATMAGLDVAFVDCNRRLLIDLGLLDDMIRRLKGEVAVVLVTHIYGRRVDMNAVHRLADRWGILVVEDLAEAHGVRPDPRSAAAVWSFYRNKIVAGEEGGAVAFGEACPGSNGLSPVQLANLARRLRCLGFGKEHIYQHLPRGHNYRLSNLHSDAILESLSLYPGNVERRRLLEARWEKDCLAEWRMPRREAPWVYDFRVHGLTAYKQRSIVASLNREGIAARPGFYPMSDQEEYRTARRISRGVVELASREVIYLPLSLGVGSDTWMSKVVALADVTV